MNKQKLLARVVSSRKNVRFRDFIILLEAFGFVYKRTVGSHNIYKHNDIPIPFSVQERKGEAKPYQVEQFLALVEEYDLKMANNEEDNKNE